MASAAMGTTPRHRGVSRLSMGVAARSAIMMAMTSSKGCSCPTCRLPISRRAQTARQTNRTLRIKTVSMAQLSIFSSQASSFRRRPVFSEIVSFVLSIAPFSASYCSSSGWRRALYSA